MLQVKPPDGQCEGTGHAPLVQRAFHSYVGHCAPYQEVVLKVCQSRQRESQRSEGSGRSTSKAREHRGAE